MKGSPARAKQGRRKHRPARSLGGGRFVARRFTRRLHVRSPLIARVIILALVAGALGVAAHAARSSTPGKICINTGGSRGTHPDGNKRQADGGDPRGTASPNAGPLP